MLIPLINIIHRQSQRSMGSYNAIPKNPEVNVNWPLHEFESQYVQRIKQTPFTNAQVYSLDPPIFIDEAELRLGHLVQPRMATQQLFPPQQLLRMFQNIVLGLAELEERGIEGHGDLSFDTIYYDKRKKHFKIAHPAFSPVSGYELTKNHQRFSFLSPEQLLALTDSQGAKPRVVSLKSDLFTLGVLMCQVSTLTSSTEIYCPDTYNIFDLEIQNRLELIKQHYPDPYISNKIQSWFKELLQYDDNDRKSPVELKRLLCSSDEPLPPPAGMIPNPQPYGERVPEVKDWRKWAH